MSESELLIGDIRARQSLARLKSPAQSLTFTRTTTDSRWLLVGAGQELLVVSLAELPTARAPADSASLPAAGPLNLHWESISKHDGILGAFALDRNDRRVATGAGDARIHIVDLPARRVLRTISTDERNISALAFSPDGHHLASGSWDRRVTLWDVNTGEAIWTAGGHRELVSALAFSGDGSLLASGSYDKSIRVRDATTGETLTRLVGHRSEVCGIAFLPGPNTDGSATANNSQRLASFDSVGTLKTWRVRGHEWPDVVSDGFRRIIGLACPPDPKAQWLAVLESVNEKWHDPRISLVDLRRRRKVGELFVDRGHNPDLYALDVSCDGKWLAAGTARGDVLIWEAQALAACVASDASSGEPRLPSPLHLKMDKRVPCPKVKQRDGFMGPTCWVYNIVFCQDPGAPEVLALTRFGGGTEVWDISSRRPIFEQPGPPQPCFRNCAFLFDSGRPARLATVDAVGTIRMQDADDGRVLAERATQLPAVSPCLRVCPDGGLMAYPTIDHQIALVRSSDLALASILRGHTQVVGSVAFSPDGTRLASAGADRTIRIWDVATGKEVASLHGHEYAVYCLAFTADGSTLISGGGDNTLRFWHAPN